MVEFLLQQNEKMNSTNAQLSTKIDELTNKAAQISFEINNALTKLETEFSETSNRYVAVSTAITRVKMLVQNFSELFEDISKNMNDNSTTIDFCIDADFFDLNENETTIWMSQTPSIPPAVALSTTSSITLSIDDDLPVNITVPSFLNIQKYNG